MIIRLLLVVLLSIGMIACSDEDDQMATMPDVATKATCLDCHTSETMLKATVAPDPPLPADEGEG